MPYLHHRIITAHEHRDLNTAQYTMKTFDGLFLRVENEL